MLIGFHSLATSLRKSQQRFLPRNVEDPEVLRLAKLIVGFASMGGAFAILFAVYYLWIGHYDGAFVILLNSLLFVTFPLACVKKGYLDSAGILFVLALLIMFSWLSFIEGGVKGHAVAWLATMPFCSQLLIMKRVHVIWINLLTLASLAFFSADELMGLSFPMSYPKDYHGWVTLLGYTGLGLFMFTLGAIGEYYRREAMRERDRAEARLHDAIEELTQLNLEKNEFMGIAAHDLNNPLSVVCGYAEMILEFKDLPQNEVMDSVRAISESSNRMRKIVQDVLDVNTIESGKYPLRPESVELGSLVESCLKTYASKAEEKGLQIEKQIAELSGTTDPGALTQILDNLISNAVKYAVPDGTLRCALIPENDFFRIEVFNQGRGFSEEDKQKLFKRFAKCSTRPTAGEGSVGLGLSITQKIVHAMGGTIVCESELNQGALFRVRLPLMLTLESSASDSDQKNSP